MKLVLIVLAVIVLSLTGLLLYTDRTEAPTVNEVDVSTETTTEGADPGNEADIPATSDESEEPGPDMGDEMSDSTDTPEPASEVEVDASSDTETEVSTDTNADEDGNSVVFDLTGVNYAFSETRLVVQKGDEVTVNFTSESGFHDWVVDEFDVATAKVQPSDGVTSVTFTADQAGEFEYYCSVGTHRAQGMIGTLVVEE